MYRAPAPPREPSPPSSLGPASSPELPEPSRDATNFATVEETLENSGLLEGPFSSPVYGSQEDLDSRDRTPYTPSKKIVEPWQAESPFASELDPLDNLDHLRYSSQLSSESLRRQALSPRKPKQKKDQFNLAPMPTFSFSAKLAAEMANAEEEDEDSLIDHLSSSLSTKKSDDIFVDAVEHIVEGSDPESEAEWNDTDVFLSPNEAGMNIRQSLRDLWRIIAGCDRTPFSNNSQFSPKLVLLFSGRNCGANRS